MKGFIFSIEALISIIILISFLSIINFYFLDTTVTTNYQIEQTQNKQIITFYFNEEINPPVLENKTCLTYLKKQNNDLLLGVVCK